MGKQAVVLSRSLKEKHALAMQQLNSKPSLENLQSLVNQAVTREPGLRCAIPLQEDLTFSRSSPGSTTNLIVLAADGSQINPSHHDAIQFAAINLGAIRFIPSQPPVEIVESKLIAGNDLFTAKGTLTEEMIALLRDVQERQLLVRIASTLHAPVIALTDGPIEIYGEPKSDPDFERQFSEYLSSLRVLASLNVLIAGFVDKPGADLVVRLLELTLADNSGKAASTVDRSLAGINDLGLFSELIPSGGRSAVFGLQSRSAARFNNELGLHFFYLNTGREGHPSIARVEIPQWVASDASRVDLVHSALVDQCQIMGSQPYPYALHRAHEIAVIRFDEKQSIAAMIADEYYRHGLQPGQSSGKQSAKDLSGKARYER